MRRALASVAWAVAQDLVALVAVVVFGDFHQCGWHGCAGPCVGGSCRSGAWLQGSMTVVTILLLTASLVSTACLAAALAVQPPRPARRRASPGQANRFVFALLPLGCAMWTAHYSYHFLASPAGFIPPAQRFVADFAGGFLGPAGWNHNCCAVAAPWLLKFEIILLGLGLLLSLHTGHQIAMQLQHRVGLALRDFSPWAALMVLLYATGVWIFLQPMEMRGAIEMIR